MVSQLITKSRPLNYLGSLVHLLSLGNYVQNGLQRLHAAGADEHGFVGRGLRSLSSRILTQQNMLWPRVVHMRGHARTGSKGIAGYSAVETHNTHNHGGARTLTTPSSRIHRTISADRAPGAAAPPLRGSVGGVPFWFAALASKELTRLTNARTCDIARGVWNNKRCSESKRLS
eukprot:954095-Pelagomonas_calceolata.AAC.3